MLREADLTASAWAGSAFFDCDLDGATVVDARVAGCRFHGSTVDRVIGADALRGIVIDPDRAIALGLRVLDAMSVTTDEEREPPT